MRDGFRKYIAAGAILAMLGVTAPQPALAFEKTDWIPPGSCAAEVAAFNAANPYAEPHQNAQFYLEWAWSYRFEGGAGSIVSPKGMREAAEQSRANAAYDEAHGDRGGAARANLTACSYDVAAASVQGIVNRLAPKGLPAIVSLADCALDDKARLYSPPPKAGYGRRQAANMVEGMVFNLVMYDRGRGMPREDMVVLAKPINPSGMADFDAAYALSKCLYRKVLERHPGDFLTASLGGGSAMPVGPSAPVETCIGDSLAAMNRTISDVDKRLDWFMTDSPYAKIEGQKAASPMLVVTMWGLEQQIAAIKANCPNSEKFKAHMADLQASLQSAKDACDQIQSGGGQCVATEPEKAS